MNTTGRRIICIMAALLVVALLAVHRISMGLGATGEQQILWFLECVVLGAGLGFIIGEVWE